MTAEPFVIRYEDEHLLVVDKPAGLVVHPARGHREGTLAQLLADAAAGGADPERAGIVHRLDRDTSGLLLVAPVRRRPTAACSTRLRGGRSSGSTSRSCGAAPARSGTIEAPIRRDPKLRTRMAVGGNFPRQARTHFTLERSCPAIRCCVCGWRQAAPSDPGAPAGDPARSWRPGHGPRMPSGCGASSCTPPAWPSITRSPGGASR
jgi:23S rRNA-/tRNA-specific pseudouridylate synthase